uniref:J domain-containing protein n=2 Tax=Cyanobacteriota TaxID=1117 RepID=UPI0030DB3449
MINGLESHGASENAGEGTKENGERAIAFCLLLPHYLWGERTIKYGASLWGLFTMARSSQQSRTTEKVLDVKTRIAQSHYGLLGLSPTASPLEIRQRYRELSKQFHPDTTVLPEAEATAKFQRLNEAYGILSSPERRSLYDLQIGFSRYSVIQPLQNEQGERGYSNSAYLDPTDRPLSAGEIFALFIMGLTFVGCVLLAIALGVSRQNLNLEGLF